MQIWAVRQNHIKKEGDELVAVVIASSENEARLMLSKIGNGIDPRYGVLDWNDSKTASCISVGVANSGVEPSILIFQPIDHRLVYGARDQLKDLFYAAVMQSAKEPVPGE